MPLLPIDLQTLFAHMNQVGREQAVQKDVAPQYQFVQGNEIVKKSAHNDSAVNETRQVGEGLEKVKDEKKGQGKEKQSAQEREDADAEAKKKKYFEDPDLGHHVNIMG
jgi:hypothetical protein